MPLCGVVVGRMRGAVRQHHADRLGDGAHGVGGEHGAAGAAARQHVALERVHLLGGDAAGLARGAALGPVHDGEVGALLGPRTESTLARRAGARIEHQAEGVGAGERHQRGGAGLVAARDHDHRIAVMGVVADLEAVGGDVARHQAVARRRRALRQRVGHRRRADHQPLPAARGDQLDQQVGDGAHAVVAAMGVGPGAGDGDDGVGLGGAIGIEAGGADFDARFLPVGAAVLCHDPDYAGPMRPLPELATAPHHRAPGPASRSRRTSSHPEAISVTSTSTEAIQGAPRKGPIP